MTSELAVQVGPLFAAGANADPARFAELNRMIDIRKSDGFLKKVNIWDVSGRVVYADDPSQIGRQFEPPPEAVRAITDGAVSAEFESEPEASNLSFDGSEPGFVEVYVPLGIDRTNPRSRSRRTTTSRGRMRRPTSCSGSSCRWCCSCWC